MSFSLGRNAPHHAWPSLADQSDPGERVRNPNPMVATTGDLAIATLDAEIASTIARITGTSCALIDASTGPVT